MKKPKLEDFYAYVYAMDPQQYIQAIYQYDHYSRRTGASAFHPWPSQGVNKSGTKVRDSPIFQHTDRLLPQVDRERTLTANVTKKQDSISPQPPEDVQKAEFDNKETGTLDRTEPVVTCASKSDSDETPSGSNEITSSTSPPLSQSIVCEPPERPLPDSLLRALPEEARKYIERLQCENEKLRQGQANRDRLIEQLKIQQMVFTRSETSKPSPPVQEVTTSQDRDIEIAQEPDLALVPQSEQDGKMLSETLVEHEPCGQLSCDDSQTQNDVTVGDNSEQKEEGVSERNSDYKSENAENVQPVHQSESVPGVEPDRQNVESNRPANSPTPTG